MYSASLDKQRRTNDASSSSSPLSSSNPTVTLSNNPSSDNKRSRTDDTSSSSSLSSTVTNNLIVEEMYDLTDVANVLGNIDYTTEIQYVPFLSRSNYYDERILQPLINHPYGRGNRTLFHHACAFNRHGRVEELLRYNADPDFQKTSFCPSGINWAIIHGHFTLVDYLMTHHYEPCFRQYERGKGLPVSSPVSTSSPIPVCKRYSIPVPGNRSTLFSSVSTLFFLINDFSTNDRLGYYGADFGVVTDAHIQCLHRLLYHSSTINSRSTDNSNIAKATMTTARISSVSSVVSSSSPSYSSYSVFWHCSVVEKWLPFVIAAMVLCGEPHPMEILLDMWETVREENSVFPYFDVLIYSAAIRVNNIPLLRALEQRFPIVPKNECDLMYAMVCHGTVDLVREYYLRARRRGNDEGLFTRVSTIAVKREDNYAMLKYLRDYMPQYVWDHYRIRPSRMP